MASLLVDIEEFLKEKSLITEDGEDTFRDFRPEKPDNVVVLSEYAGTPTPIDVIADRSVQVLVRNTDADSAKSLAINIYNALKPIREDQKVQLTSTRWAQIFLRQTPFRISTDKSNRVFYGFNCGIITNTD